MRKSELLMAKWSDIDFECKELRLNDTKAGRVPKLEDNPYIIPGNIKGKHMVNISKPWLRIRKAAKLEDVRNALEGHGKMLMEKARRL